MRFEQSNAPFPSGINLRRDDLFGLRLKRGTFGLREVFHRGHLLRKGSHERILRGCGVGKALHLLHGCAQDVAGRDDFFRLQPLRIGRCFIQPRGNLTESRQIIFSIPRRENRVADRHGFHQSDIGAVHLFQRE